MSNGKSCYSISDFITIIKIIYVMSLRKLHTTRSLKETLMKNLRTLKVNLKNVF